MKSESQPCNEGIIEESFDSHQSQKASYYFQDEFAAQKLYEESLISDAIIITNPYEDYLFIKENFVEDHTTDIHKSSSLSLELHQLSPVYDDNIEVFYLEVHDGESFSDEDVSQENIVQENF